MRRDVHQRESNVTAGTSHETTSTDESPGAAPTPRRRVAKALPPTVTFVVLMSVWYAITQLDLGLARIPPPHDVAAAFWDMTTSGELANAFWQSGTVFLAGFFPGVIVAIVMGIIIGNIKALDLAFSPYLYAFFSTPFIALVPLFLVIFGYGVQGKIAIVFTLVWIFVLLQTLAGIRNVDRELHEIAESFCAPWWRRWFEVTLPAAVPFIVAGVRLGIGRALVGVVVAEFETFVRGGFGGIIMQRSQAFNLAEALVPAVVLSLIGVGLFFALFRLELRLSAWKKSA